MKSLVSSIKNAISVPLKFHWSVLILPLLLIFYNGVAYGIPLFILIFGSLLFHEYAHVWMAQRSGLYVPYVITHGFGAAAMVHEPDPSNFKRGMKVAGIGPAASFLLFGVGIIVHAAVQSVWTLYFVYINFLLGAFNLLPLFPSDGGRILYSLLGMKFGGLKAIKWAVYTSWALCGAGILYALYAGSFWLLIILVLLGTMSIQEKKVTEARLQGYDVHYK